MDTVDVDEKHDSWTALMKAFQKGVVEIMLRALRIYLVPNCMAVWIRSHMALQPHRCGYIELQASRTPKLMSNR